MTKRRDTTPKAGGRRRDRGMTMVELLMVMAMMGILATISFAGIRQILPRWRLNAAARTVRADLLDTKTRATRSMREFRVRFVDTSQYVIEEGDARIASANWSTADASTGGQVGGRNLPNEYQGVTIVTSKTGTPVVFRPNGTIDPTNGNITITISNGSQERALEVSMAGRIRIL